MHNESLARRRLVALKPLAAGPQKGNSENDSMPEVADWEKITAVPRQDSPERVCGNAGTALPLDLPHEQVLDPLTLPLDPESSCVSTACGTQVTSPRPADDPTRVVENDARVVMAGICEGVSETKCREGCQVAVAMSDDRANAATVDPVTEDFCASADTLGVADGVTLAARPPAVWDDEFEFPEEADAKENANLIKSDSEVADSPGAADGVTLSARPPAVWDDEVEFPEEAGAKENDNLIKSDSEVEFVKELFEEDGDLSPTGSPQLSSPPQGTFGFEVVEEHYKKDVFPSSQQTPLEITSAKTADCLSQEPKAEVCTGSGPAGEPPRSCSRQSEDVQRPVDNSTQGKEKETEIDGYVLVESCQAEEVDRTPSPSIASEGKEKELPAAAELRIGEEQETPEVGKGIREDLKLDLPVKQDSAVSCSSSEMASPRVENLMYDGDMSPVSEILEQQSSAPGAISSAMNSPVHRPPNSDEIQNLNYVKSEGADPWYKWAEQNLELRENHQQTLRVFCAVWNLHGKPPPADISEFIPRTPEHHIYVIGTCECERSIEKSIFWQDKSRWEGQVRNHLGEDYRLIKAHNMSAIHVMVLVHSSLWRYIWDIRSAQVATGLGNFVGNKGGTMIGFMAGHTSLLFVNTHLAAHQHKMQERTQNLSRILTDSSLRRKKGTSGIHEEYDATFVLGDINARISASRCEVDQWLADNDMNQCLSKDQLLPLLHANDVLTGTKENSAGFWPAFEEAPITFRPTFKFDTHTDQYDTSKKKRVPSWTDRVLWRKGSPVRSMVYNSIDTLRYSDHRPVFGQFEVVVDLCNWQGPQPVKKESSTTCSVM